MTAIATVTESTALLEAASTNNYHNDCSDHQHHGENGAQKGLSEDPQSGSYTQYGCCICVENDDINRIFEKWICICRCKFVTLFISFSFTYTVTLRWVLLAAKSIGMLGSIAIAVNSLAGPAVLQLPFQFQQSGLIPTIICLIGTGILSAYCCLHTANTVSMMPNNHNFDHCVEFSDPYRYFWNEKAYTFTQLLFLATAVCLNVAAIIDTAEGES
jgi:Transmembrane amino acid transporter protein